MNSFRLMDLKQKAQALVSYLQSLPNFSIQKRSQYSHMGAIIVDTMLQAGANWDGVKERRDKVERYEEAKTTSGFLSLLNQQKSIKDFLNWGGRKPGWVLGLVQFLNDEKVETQYDLQQWVQIPRNLEKLLELPGVREKTRDYLIKLAGMQSIAIDRHWYKALRCAGIVYIDYNDAHRIVELAAEIWQKDKSDLDTSVWRYFRQFKGDDCP